MLLTCDVYGWVVHDDELLTTTQAAKRLGISRTTLAKYAQRGILVPALRLPSGQLRWRWVQIREQLAAKDDRPIADED